MKFFDDLTWRGLIQQTSDPRVAELLSTQSLTAYCGFDPTADSLHVGSLLQILNLVRLQKAGHKPIAVVGGATGMIGDPSGKTQERSLLDNEALEQNLKGIQSQLERFLDFSGTHAARVVNNADWFRNFSYIDFLRDIGKHFSVNMMLGKESVRARLEDRDHGISYTEFSYMLLQSYDFLHLHDKMACNLQIGGSDQWGNIVAGIDLVRRTRQKEVFGMTFPLVMKSDGTKFGKSEKGNVWLDTKRTSPYEFYQFFIQTDDKDVVKLLKYYTFLTHAEITDLEATCLAAPEKREAQKVLARILTTMVHGSAETTGAENAAQALFGTEIKKLDARTLQSVFADAPRTELPRTSLDNAGTALLDLLVSSGLCASKGAARKDLTAGGVYLNNERLTDVNYHLTTKDLIAGQFAVLRKGKKTYHLVAFL